MLRGMAGFCPPATCRTFPLTTHLDVPYIVGMEDELIRQAMRALAERRWGKATPADRAEAARKMVAGQRKARLRKRGKGGTK